MPTFAAMFKRCLAILLIAALGATGIQRYLVYAGFQLNRNYIAKELCVNRSRPWMHCNGRCYFMRKIKAAEEEEKKQAAKDALERMEVSFFQHASSFRFQQEFTERIENIRLVKYCRNYTGSYTASLLRPPRV